MNNADNQEQTPDITAGEDSKPASIRIDEIIKHLFSSEKQALVKFVNGALGENHDPGTAELIELKTEFIRRNYANAKAGAGALNLDKIIADMMFLLNGIAYHIEFQTKAGQAIAIRIIGYGIEHALGKMRNTDISGGVVLELPVPVLIQIDKDEKLTDKIPAQIKLSGRDEALTFDITVIKLWEHDVDALVSRGFYLLLPFVLAKHRKGKNADEGVQALLSDIHEIEEAIAKLYENGEIFSNLRSDLYAATDSILRSINARYYDNNLEIDRELKKMETTRALFASEIKAKGMAEGVAIGNAEGEARGEARGEAKGVAKANSELTKIIKLHLQKKTPDEISEELGIAPKKVTGFLQKSGLMDLKQ